MPKSGSHHYLRAKGYNIEGEEEFGLFLIIICPFLQVIDFVEIVDGAS